MANTKIYSVISHWRFVWIISALLLCSGFMYRVNKLNKVVLEDGNLQRFLTPTFDKNATTRNSIFRDRVVILPWPEWMQSLYLQPWLSNTKPTPDPAENLNRRLPQVIGIGAKKCGTTALWHFLSLHPHFKAPGKDGGEVHFFDTLRYEKGLDFYRSLMPISDVGDVTFEKSPRYLYTPQVPSRIKEWNPDVKFILVLCDPVLRAFSDYHHVRYLAPPQRQDMIRDFSSFTEYVDTALSDITRIKENPTGTLGYGTFDSFVLNAWNQRTFPLTIITNGIYVAHLKHWLTYFRPEQIHIVDGDKLIKSPWSELMEVQNFFGLEVLIKREDFYYDDIKGFYCLKERPCMTDDKGNTKGPKGPKISQQSLAKLRSFFQPYNEQLFAITKRNFTWI